MIFVSPKEDPNLQRHREVGPALWLRAVARSKIKYKRSPTHSRETSSTLGSQKLCLTKNCGTIEMEIKKRKWGWIGHTLRKPVSNGTYLYREDPRRPEKTRKDPKRPEKTRKDTQKDTRKDPRRP